MAKQGSGMRVTRGWPLLGVLLVAACVPETAAYLTLPVVPLEEEALELAVVEVNLAELEKEMGELRVEDLAFYHFGREPVPHELRDTDGDGRADVAVVVIPVPTYGARLTAVCPGPRAEGSVPSGGTVGAVVVQYDAAYR